MVSVSARLPEVCASIPGKAGDVVFCRPVSPGGRLSASAEYRRRVAPSFVGEERGSNCIYSASAAVRHFPSDILHVTTDTFTPRCCHASL